MDAGIGSFKSSVVTPVPPVLETAQRAARPEPRPETEAAPTPLPARGERRVEIDPATQSYVFRTIDVESGIVVRQTPDEMRLKLRAYVDGLTADAQKPLVERVA